MNILTSNYDVIFLGIIIFSSVMALVRGAVAELLSLSVWFIAFSLMRHFGGEFDVLIPPSVSNQILRSVIIFIIIFIIIAVLVAIIKKISASIISSIGLGGLNYLLGAVFGAIRGILICAAVVIVIETLQLDPSYSWRKSRLFVILSPVVELITKSIASQARKFPDDNKISSQVRNI